MSTECDLTKKFDEMFSDELVIDAFYEWNKKRLKKNKKWYDDFFILVPISILIIAASIIYYIFGRDRVEQSVYEFEGHTTFNTWVWVDGKIIRVWRTEIPQVTDSLVKAQKSEGEKIIKTFNQ